MATEITPERLEEIERTMDRCQFAYLRSAITAEAFPEMAAALREAWEREAAALRDSRRLDHLDKIKIYKSPSYGYNGDKYSIYLDGGLDHNGSGEALSLFGAIDRDMEKRNAD